MHQLAAVEHPADLAVGAHDPVLEHERPVLVGAGLTDSRIRSRSSGWTMLIIVRFALAMKLAGG